MSKTAFDLYQDSRSALTFGQWLRTGGLPEGWKWPNGVPVPEAPPVVEVPSMAPT